LGQGLELHHRQARNSLKVAEITGGNAVAEFQGLYPDQPMIAGIGAKWTWAGSYSIRKKGSCISSQRVAAAIDFLNQCEPVIEVDRDHVSTTMDQYGNASALAKRKANRPIVQRLLQRPANQEVSIQ
jgi:hypothetical protein